MFTLSLSCVIKASSNMQHVGSWQWERSGRSGRSASEKPWENVSFLTYMEIAEISISSGQPSFLFVPIYCLITVTHGLRLDNAVGEAETRFIAENSTVDRAECHARGVGAAQSRGITCTSFCESPIFTRRGTQW